MSAPSPWLRAYRAALRLLPEAVRERHGDPMAAVFARLLADARARGGRAGAARAAAAELLALLRFAARERSETPLPRGVDERAFAWTPSPDPSPRRRPRMLASLSQDVRYAVRTLLRSPGFTLTCVATLALAIGANTAIFSVIDGILLKRLPFADPDRLVVIGHRDESPTDLASTTDLSSTTPGNFYDLQAGTAGKPGAAFESMAAFATTAQNLTLGGTSERVNGVQSAGSLFDVLGTPALLGRTFRAAEDGPGAEGVVVLSHGLWQRRFGADPAAVGRTLTLGGNPYLILGVMPPGFAFPDGDAEFWIPARFKEEFRGNRDQYFLLAAARLAPGVGADQARAQLDTVMDRIRRAWPQETGDTTAGVVPMKDLLVDGVRTRLWTLMGAVLLILLIACANLGNLLLARAAGRRREIALRNALGARPARLVRQMLTESLLLALAGGAAGLLLGYLLLDGLLALLPADLPRSQEIGLDLRVLGFTLLVALASGLAFGLLPALQLSSGRGPGDALRDGARGSGRTRWARTGLVVAECALALMLLVGAGLLVRSFGKLVEVDPGFQTSRLLTFRVGVPTSVYDEPARAVFFTQLQERLRTLPGVQAVAMTSTLPVAGYGSGAWFNLLDRPLPANETPPAVPYRLVSTDYLQVMGIPLLRGRPFDAGDRLDATRAVIVSEAVARRFWPGEDPLGKQIYLGAPDNRLFPDGVVVGVAADVKQDGLADPTPETVYFPATLLPGWPFFTFALRTSADPTALAAAAREQVRQLDRAVPIFQVRTMDDVLAESVAPARSSMLLLGVFSALALVLAVLGVFGVLSYTVSQRTTELGIRLALGASARSVGFLVLGQGMLQVLAGVILGLGGALALTRLLESLLFGVTPTDPATFAAVAVLLTGVAALGSYLPARRATQVDPNRVLRQE